MKSPMCGTLKYRVRTHGLMNHQMYMYIHIYLYCLCTYLYTVPEKSLMYVCLCIYIPAPIVADATRYPI